MRILLRWILTLLAIVAALLLLLWSRSEDTESLPREHEVIDNRAEPPPSVPLSADTVPKESILPASRDVVKVAKSSAAGKLRGRVFDNDGRLLPEAVVLLDPATDRGLVSRTSRTDKAGSYEFLKRSGPHVVHARKGAKSGRINVEVPEGSEDFLLPDLVLREGSEVFGRVLDQWGQAVAGVRVEAFSNDVSIQFFHEGSMIEFGFFRTSTDEEGRFSFEGLDAGKYTIKPSPLFLGHRKPNPPKSEISVPFQGEILFRLEQEGELFGIVVDAVSGSPLAKFSVQGFEYSNPQGQFAVPRNGAQSETLTISAPGYHRVDLVMPREGFESKENPWRIALVRADPPGSLQIRALDREAKPIVGITAHIFQSPGLFREPVRDDGALGFVIAKDLEQGRYAVLIEAPGTIPKREEIEVSAGKQTEVDVLLDPASWVRLHVQDAKTGMALELEESVSICVARGPELDAELVPFWFRYSSQVKTRLRGILSMTYDGFNATKKADLFQAEGELYGLPVGNYWLQVRRPSEKEATVFPFTISSADLVTLNLSL